MKQAHKHILGAYLNMARHNAYITLSHTSKILGAAKDGDEARLSEMKAITVLQNGKPEEKERAIELLHKHLLFLKPMIDNDISEKDYREKVASLKIYHNILTTIFSLLNLLRDKHSHYAFNDERLDSTKIKEQENKLVHYLKNCFDGARRISKDRFGFSENDFKFLTSTGKGNRYDEVDKLDENGKPLRDNKGRIQKIHQERGDFAYKLWINGDVIQKGGKSIQLKKLSPKGIVFLICLFIEKRYATMLLDNSELKFFATDERDVRKKIIREMFSVYRMWLPKARIDSEKSEYALGLDMLNELKKCPDELFETFSKEDRDLFRIQSENEDNSEILMKRYQNRFHYFAMRYIDENKLFKNIRFQVSLGKYRYEFYDKKCIDSSSEDRVRALQKELNGFGRLGEIEEKRKEEWADYIRPYEEVRQDSADEKPYITDHRANYVVNGNRIGMAFNSETRKVLDNGCFIPKIEGKETKCKSPDCWLSIHEFPAMVFHNLLCDKDKKNETENIIKGCVKNYRDLFSDIKNGKLQPISKEKEVVASAIKKEYGLNYDDVPEKLQDYLTKNPVDINVSFNKLSGERIEKMISWSERKLDRLKEDKKIVGDRKNNQIGKGRYVDIKPGRLARFLSEDIIMFQPTEDNGKDKLTGMNFQIMQSSLAIYNKSIEELKRMFVSAKLIEGSIEHPFLKKVLNKAPKDTISFYEFYLEKRIEFLKGIKPEEYRDPKKCGFLYADRKKWDERNDEYYQNLAERYLFQFDEEGKIISEQSIELPRGLFNEAIREKLKSKYPDNNELAASLSKERCNVSFMIAEYFKYVHKDGNQKFYTFKRTYDVFNKLNNKRNDRKQLQKEYYSLSEIEKEAKEESIKEKITDLAWYELEKSNKYGRYNKDQDFFRPDLEKIKTAIKSFKEEDFELGRSREIARRYKIAIKKIRRNERIEQDDLEDVIVDWEECRLARKMKSLLNDFKKNEKVIRQYKVQDILLFLMAKDILISSDWGKGEAKEIEQYKLKDIDLNGEKNILSMPIPFSMTFKMEDGTTRTIKQDSLKLKNYGDFFKFVYDQRIKTLLPGVKSVEILDREILEKELGQYDLERSEIFKLIFEFEKSIVSQNQEYMNKKHDFKELLELYSTDKDKNLIRLIRNAFCHNSYPKIDNLEEQTKTIPEIAASLPEMFSSLTQLK